MMSRQFEIDGIGYVIDDWGVVHQAPPVITQVYDRAYVERRYDSLSDRGRQMSMLRIGFLVGALSYFGTILDVGYGNGDFLAALQLWQAWKIECAGLDVSGYPLPADCLAANGNDLYRPWHVVTFFDSLEHMPSLAFLASMQARHIAVTLPFCHIWQLGVDWFASWKHRRPGEHMHHFSLSSLTLMMRDYGYQYLTHQSLEDGIRLPMNGHDNTFTAIYKSQDFRNKC